MEDIVDDYHGRISTVAVSRMSDILQSSVHRILTDQLKLHPYRIQLVHQLTDQDKKMRLDFANEMLDRNNREPNFIHDILWTDEAHFSLNGQVNTWNMRIWAAENPHEHLEHSLHSSRVTVWAGFNSRFILDPYFFEENGEVVSINVD